MHSRVHDDDIKRGEFGQVEPKDVVLGGLIPLGLQREVPRKFNPDVLHLKFLLFLLAAGEPPAHAAAAILTACKVVGCGLLVVRGWLFVVGQQAIIKSESPSVIPSSASHLRLHRLCFTQHGFHTRDVAALHPAHYLDVLCHAPPAPRSPPEATSAPRPAPGQSTCRSCTLGSAAAPDSLQGGWWLVSSWW